MNNTNNFTFIDLFSGIGGFHSAFASLGGRCLGFSEINNDAVETYCDNYKISKTKNLGDITNIRSLPKHDILVAGVPCQSWSIAGKNLGFEDDRGQLWNDTIYLLNQSQPKAFIFENVKGLFDPRNRKSLNYILDRIKSAGYFANYYLLNSYDFGVLQNRVRVYIIGFKDENAFRKFKITNHKPNPKKLYEILDNIEIPQNETKLLAEKDLFGNYINLSKTRIQKNNSLNDFFIFSDIRNGHSTIHSWDILETTEREKYICLLLLKNRRKKNYGLLDGNPLSYEHFQLLDNSIKELELEKLVKKGILKKVKYYFKIINKNELTVDEQLIINIAKNDTFSLDELKQSKNLRLNKINIKNILVDLKEKEKIECIEMRYEFKFTKISSGIFGVNRIYLPTSDVYPTLVASDTNDFIATKNISAKSPEEYKEKFITEIYNTQSFRQITKEEACILQGFPVNFILPESRSRWMKLIGNSVSIPVIQSLAKSIIKTGILEKTEIEVVL